MAKEIVINFGDAKLVARRLLLNEYLKKEIELEELHGKAFQDGKMTSKLYFLKWYEKLHQNFADSLISIENLKDEDGNEITVESFKSLEVPQDILIKLANARRDAEELLLEQEANEAGKN